MKKKSKTGDKRQFVPQTMQTYMYNNPAYMNSIQSNGLTVQGQLGAMQVQTPVQQQANNLDGAIARPLISGIY